MKAELVFNNKHEPRIELSEFDVAEQVALQGCPDLDLVKIINTTHATKLVFEIINNDKIKVITAMKTEIDELKKKLAAVEGESKKCAGCPTMIYKHDSHHSDIPGVGDLCNPCHKLWSKEN